MPKVPKEAVSSTRPATNPPIAPKIGPRRSETATSVTSTTSGCPSPTSIHSAMEICTRVARRINPPAFSASIPVTAGSSVPGFCCLTLLRTLGARLLGEDDHLGQRVEVDERRHLDPLEEVDVLLADRLHRPDGDAPRVEGLELPRRPARGDDESPGLDQLVLVHAVEDERGRARPVPGRFPRRRSGEWRP